MKRLFSFRNRTPDTPPHGSARNATRARALFALILLSLLIAACSPRTLAFRDLSDLLVEDALPAAAGDNQSGDQIEPIPNSPTPPPVMVPVEPTATPIPVQAPPRIPPTATQTSQPPTATATTIPPTATSVPPTATQVTCSFSSSASYENTLVALINQERANQGAGALTVSSQLTAATRQHSRDMACNDFFSHTGSDGSSPFDRMAWSGFSYSTAAENIYAGSGSFNSPQQAFTGWMNSPGHRTNMLNPVYTHVGVGYIYIASSTYGGYYTANFAKP